MVCAYKITISSTSISAVEYKLTAYPYGHDLLHIGIPKIAHSDGLEGHLYMVYVPHKNPKAVTIQLTKFSGEVDLFASRANKNPDAETDDTSVSHEGFIVYKGLPSLSGTYYIRVVPLQICSYSISVSVLAEDGALMDYALTLDEGVPQRGVLLPLHEHPERYYKISLNLDQDWEGTLRIVVNQIKGKALWAVSSNEFIPTATSNTWSTKGNELEILSSDANFKRNGTFHIGVFVNWDAEIQGELNDVIFTITYHLKENRTDSSGKDKEQTQSQAHILLTLDHSFHGTIKSNEISFFKAYLLPQYESVTIYKQNGEGEVDLFVSTDPKNMYPVENKLGDTPIYTTRNSHKDFVRIGKEDLDRLLSTSATTYSYLYMSIVPHRDQEEVSFSLSISPQLKTKPLIPTVFGLEDGRQQIFEVPQNKTPAHFYFYPISRHYSVITVTCPEKEITIYANSIDTEVGTPSVQAFFMPDEKVHDFSSRDSESHSVSFAHITVPYEYKSNYTRITLTIFFEDHTLSTSDENESKTFTILASSQTAHIFTGWPYYGAVEKDHYTYFLFTSYQASSTILISMTTLNDGDADLVVSYGVEERPTIEKHQFASISSQKTELIEIDKQDVYPLQFTRGSWVVGVYGRTKSTFTLTVILEDQKIVNLKSGTLFEMYLKEGSTIFFKFYHDNDKNLRINLDKFSGNIVAYVNNVPEDKDFVSHLPNRTDSTWTIGQHSNSVLAIEADNPQACSDCLYLIAIEAKLSGKFGITVTEGIQFIKIQNGLHYINQLRPLMPSFYVFSAQNADEATMNLNMRGSELQVYVSNNPTVNSSNYIWKTILTPSQPTDILKLRKADYDQKEDQRSVWDGSRQVESERNSFYIYFYNPTPLLVNYSFTAATKESMITLRAGVKHAITIEPKATSSFIFLSSEDGELIKVIIEVMVAHQHALFTYNAFELALKKGLNIKAQFFSEKMTAGTGTEVILTNENPLNDRIENKGTVTYYHLRQIATTRSKKGKYIFEIENIFNQNVNITTRIYTASSGAIAIDPNSQHSSLLTKGKSETLETYLADTGSWYLWVYVCSGNLELNIGTDPSDLENEAKTIDLPAEGQYLYRIRNPIPNLEYIKLAREGGSSQADVQVRVSSSYFKEIKLYDFEPVNHDHTIDYEYEERANGQLTVYFKTLEFHTDKYDPSDEVKYHIKLCPYKEGIQNLCNIGDGCKIEHHTVMTKLSSKSLESKFQKVPSGIYSIQITANIDHLSKFVRSIPYEAIKIEIGQPTAGTTGLTNILLIALGIILLCIVSFVCYKGFKKLRKVVTEKKAVELEMSDPQKTYGVIGHEDEGNALNWD